MILDDQKAGYRQIDLGNSFGRESTPLKPIIYTDQVPCQILLFLRQPKRKNTLLGNIRNPKRVGCF